MVIWVLQMSLPAWVYSSIQEPLISETRTSPLVSGVSPLGYAIDVGGLWESTPLPIWLTIDPWGEMNKIRLLEASATVMIPDFNR